jgi:predicted acetyltransferase
MSSDLIYRPMTDADRSRVIQLVNQAFGTKPEQAERGLAIAGIEKFRVVHRRGEPSCGCLLLADLGQYFGGRAVSMEGVAGVAVAPEARGGGVGIAMMRQSLLEQHARGVALSTLYPATQILYRRAGYEIAGYSNQLRLDASSIGAVREDRALPMRPVCDDDWPRIEAAYRGAMHAQNGAVERRTYIWPRIREWRGDPAEGWVLDIDGRIEAYVFLLMRPDAHDRLGRKEVFCTDVQGFTRRGAKRVLAFLADYSSMVTDIVFHGGPAHPLAMLLPEQRWLASGSGEFWMLRIVDVVRALSERGYAAGLSATLGIRIEDDLIPANSGEFLLEVEGGRGRVSRGPVRDAPTLAAHVRDFASVYSGFQSASVMAMLGAVSGPPEALDAADALFAGSAPVMYERF